MLKIGLNLSNLVMVTIIYGKSNPYFGFRFAVPYKSSELVWDESTTDL